jgi:membrane-bound lytic murein transglycosylase D
MPVMRGILKKEGLPEDLIYIALIESGFSSSAKSSAKAVGYWQFIKGTGHRYGLQIDSYVDDRRDFIKSTQAAADYFKGLHNLFGAWYLAIASYNVGENRVKNVVMKYHTRDFWQLARENKLPAETINYVPKFLAARLIAKEPEKYGFTDIDYLPPLEFSEATFKTGIDLRKLAKEMNIEYDDLRDLNPAYKRGVALSKNGHLTLRVPKGLEALAISAGPNATAGSVKAYVADEDFGYYRVRRGDTISSIAHKFSTNTKRIRQLNRGNSMLIAGRRIRVPGETIGDVSGAEESSSSVGATSGSKKKTLARNRVPANQLPAKVSSQVPSGTDRKVHIVRKGESLIEIARKYQVPLRQLAQYNGINRRAMIQVGTRLEIP